VVSAQPKSSARIKMTFGLLADETLAVKKRRRIEKRFRFMVVF
jgi:hypothetical protein